MKILLTAFSILALVAAPALTVTAFADDTKKGAADSNAANPSAGHKADKNTGTGSASPSTTDKPVSKDDVAADTPSSRDDCRNGGWSKYSTPTFKNQGECLSWVNKNQRSNRNK
jgi:hypothetical protein